jgi:hypothetical protein
VTRDPGGMTLCQEQYALDLLNTQTWIVANR